MTAEVSNLARLLIRKQDALAHEVKALQNKNDLGYSSIEDNRAIDVYDTEGTPTSSFGGQFDGSSGAFSLTSPKPPTPTSPQVSAQPGLVSTGWDGYFLGANGLMDMMVTAPLGFAYVEVHAAPAALGPEFDARSTTTLLTTIHSARGGVSITGLTAGDYWVRLVARTTAGKPSDPGPSVAITVPDLVDTTQLEADLVAARDEISAAEDRLGLAEGDLDLAFEVLAQVPSNIDAAKKAAIDAAATDAATKASAAQQAALTAVGLKGEVIYQASAPTGTRASTQNLWIRSSDNKPHIWNPASTLVNKWEPVTDQAALDAAAAAVTAKTRADDAYTEATAAKGQAATALSTANGKNRIVRSTAAASSAIPGTRLGDLWWQYSDATYQIVIGEWTWNASAWVAQKQNHQTISSVDIGVLTVVGTATISNVVAEKIAAGTATIQKADIANLTVTGTSTMADVVAEKIAAQTGKFMYLEAAQINVNQIWADLAFSNEARTHLLRVLTNSDGSGYTSSVTGQGLLVTYTVKDETGATVEIQDVIKLGTFDSDFFAISKGGVVKASISNEGQIVGQSLDIEGDVTIGGTNLRELLDAVPRGALDKAELNSHLRYIGNSTGKIGLVTCEYAIQGDRQIKVEVGIETQPNGVATEVYAQLRYTLDGSQPTINSTMLVEFPLGMVSANTFDHLGFVHTIRGKTFQGGQPDGTVIKLLLVVYRGVGNDFHVNGNYRTHMYLEDIGPGIPHTPMFTPGGGRLYPPAAQAAPDPTPVPAKITKTYEASHINFRSYMGNGEHYNYNTGRAYQGLSPAGYGNLRSVFSFSSWTTLLSGATINWIDAYFYFEHWYNNAGGTARIRVHGLSSVPATWNGANLGVNSSGWPKGAGRWVRLPASLYSGFQSGAYRGLALDGDGTYNTYGIATGAKIRINYTK